MPLRLVVDTNVLVSALYKPASVPARVLEAIWHVSEGQGAACWLYDARILDEYRTVLARPKFRALDRHRIDELIDNILSRGADLGEVAAWDGALPDEGDRIFVEAALAGRAAIVTGNIKHYPLDLGFEVLPPATMLAQLGFA
ncbi:MAG: PIN domain-containing protein [Labilithrix sp.]|nr:PIN domain-containing protein [Labilithrix sp.]